VTSVCYPLSLHDALPISVTVSARLMAADGTALGEETRRSIHTGDLAPLAGFASQGSVLPARGSRGLPVVSLNVPEVDVEFLRVRSEEHTSELQSRENLVC